MNVHTHNRFQRGVTLLEVLIAILVLSFGLLGMLGMLISGLKMTSSSHYRTVAAQQLTAMADMINANTANFASFYAPPTGSIANCFTSSCTVAQLAPTDYALWQANLLALLPSGAGTVCLNGATNAPLGNSSDFKCDTAGRPTVKICWNENARVAISSGGVTGSDSSTDTCMSTQL